MTEQDRASSGGTTWWLSNQGSPNGPHTEGFLLVGLKTGTISPQTYACPVGGQVWKRLCEWPAFAGAAPAASAAAPASTTPEGAISDSVLTNQRLPAMANWICVYSLLVLPIYWLVSNLSCVMTGTTFKEESAFFVFDVLWMLASLVITLGITLFLAFGGARLRSLRRSGATMIMTGIGFDLAFCAINVFVVIGMMIAGSDQLAESTQGEVFISFLFMIAGLLSFAFEIIALIWLGRNVGRLPLSEN